MNAHNPSARLRPFRPQPFGRYTLLSHLATGGMGEIYLARLEGAQGFEKLCVIKKILPQLAEDGDFVERFVGEARTLVRLSHGSIAQVLDMGLHEAEAYMALEYVDGKDLRKVAARVRDRQVPLPLTFILYVMGRVLDALAYAHRKKDDDGEDLKLVHRDISPQNILISYEGEVKVVDFGLAKSRLSAAKTNPSIILGKFLYMSPEQARHQPVDRRSDLYAVGLTLYELIAGKNPFDGIHPGELMSVVANPKVPPLDEVEPLTPRSVTALVAKALEVDPAQRFQTAEEFRGRLQTCLMEIDANAGPESVSRFMRELFTADFQSERRLLASLKEVPRGGGAPEPRSGASEQDDGGPAPRATLPAGAILPAKTIRLDGPVEALSFHPTPRSREAGGPVNDGETRPGIPMDESTRPAFPLEALEEEARARASRLNPDTSPSVEVEPEAFNRPPPAPSPAVPAVIRPPSQTREVPLATMPPEAIPPAPWTPPAPPPSRPDMRPTELELVPMGSVVGPANAEPSPWPVEPTEPRAEPLRGAGGELLRPGATSRSPAPASGPRPGGPPPPAPLPPPAAPVPPATMPQRQALSAPSGSLPPGAPARSGAMVMPAVSAASGPFSSPPPGAPTRSGVMMMPAVSLPATPGTPARPAPGGAPSSRGVEASGADSDAEALAGFESDGAEMPVLTPEQMGHDEQAARVEEMDTNPRASRPPRAERSDDTQPRGPRDSDTDPRGPRVADMRPAAVAHEDTQPRVVLDEGFLRDAEGAAREHEERQGGARPKTGSSRVRASSPGMRPVQGGRRTGSASVIRPAPAPAPAPEPAEDEEEDADVRVSMPSHDETRRTAVPVRPNAQAAARRAGEDTRRTSMPRRSKGRSVVMWVVVLGGLGALLAGAAALVLKPELLKLLAQQFGLAQVNEGPPAAKPIERTPPPPSDTAMARAEPAPDVPPSAAPGVEAAGDSPSPTPESAPVPPPTAQAEDNQGGDSLLAPLSNNNSATKPAPPKSASPKRAPASRVRIVTAPTSKAQAELKREWKETLNVFKKLEDISSCDNLGLLCSQRDDTREFVAASEGEPDPKLIEKVKRLKREAQRQLDRLTQ
ncbi:protein kinase [Myxococcus sp. AM011]|uniref:serine/threonine-protein kinase n=1 Tax=Myxococcus sp. AM011 TaxID=2745200 RepID=UPI0015961077|nr:serine/threonine-protein kinase [Myxococcus sp. AM011]NVJ25717.1 protein kinase [Myxococcus sp. AM011]